MADAAVYSGVDDKSKIVNLALDYYIKRMAAKRLVALGRNHAGSGRARAEFLAHGG